MLKIQIITVSDTRTEKDDVSGDRLAVLAGEIGEVVRLSIVADDRGSIADVLRAACDVNGVDLILTTGGTGVAARDVTPEATLDVIEREVPGIAEHMRRATLEFTPYAVLSRGVAGIKGNTLIINLPGSPKAVDECFGSIRDILPHALKLLRGEHDSH